MPKGFQNIALWCLTGIFSCWANSDEIDYLVVDETIGAFQAEDFSQHNDKPHGLIDEVVWRLLANTDLIVNTVKQPGLRLREYLRSKSHKPWISFSLLGETKTAPMATGKQEDWLEADAPQHYHLADIHSYLWYIEKPGHRPRVTSDLSSKAVILLKSVSYPHLSRWQAQFGLHDVRATSAMHAVKMLVTERADYLFLSEASSHWHFQRLRNGSRQLYKLNDVSSNSKAGVYIVWSANTPQPLQSHFTKTLETMADAGVLHKLRKKYRFSHPQ